MTFSMSDSRKRRIQVWIMIHDSRMNRFISFLNDRLLLPKTGKIGSRLSSLERTIHFDSESFNSDRTAQREYHVLTLDVQHLLSRPFQRPSTLRTDHYEDRPLWR